MNEANEEIAKTGLPEEVIALLKIQPDSDSQEMILKGWGSGGKDYAIEDQNFPWFLSCCHIVGNLVLAGTISAWAPGAIADLTFLLIDYRSKLIELSGEEGMVLRELKTSGGLPLAELAESLEFDEAKTQALLDSLGNKKRRDNMPVKLILCDDNDVYTASNV